MAKISIVYDDYFSNLPSIVSYQNDTEYRDCLRTVFQFDPHEKYTYDGKLCAFQELDSQTQDELLFDSQAVSKNLDIWYDRTKNNDLFSTLYLHAAGRMFSTDPKIGQAILCSYDFFPAYYASMWYFFYGGQDAVVKDCREYMDLKREFRVD